MTRQVRQVVRSGWLHSALIVAAVSLYASRGLDVGDLGGDECIYLLVVQQSLREGALLLPRFLDGLFTEKPPLQLWCMGLAWRWLGESHWSARLPGLLWGLGSYLLLYRLGRRHWSPAVGLGSCLVLLSIWEIHFRHGMMNAVMEGPLVFGWLLFMTGFLDAFRQTEGPPGRWNLLLLTAGLSIGVLSKSAAGLLPLAPAVAVSLTAPGADRLRLLRRLVLAGLLAGFALTPWLLATALREPDGFLAFFWEHSVGRRVFGSFDPDHLRPAGFYWSWLADQWRDWTVWCWIGLAATSATALRQGGRVERGLVAWLLIPTLLLSSMVSKLGHYIYPIYPVLALVATLGFRCLGRWVAGAWGRIGWPAPRRVGAGLATVAFLVVGFPALRDSAERIQRPWGRWRLLRDRLQSASPGGELRVVNFTDPWAVQDWPRIYYFGPSDWRSRQEPRDPTEPGKLPVGAVLFLRGSERPILEEQLRQEGVPFQGIPWPEASPRGELHLLAIDIGASVLDGFAPQ